MAVRIFVSLLSLLTLGLAGAANSTTVPTKPAWNRAKAFAYLEARQEEWAAWEPAQAHGGACISCHTGLSYLMARRVAGENTPRPVEAALVKGVQARLLDRDAKPSLDDSGVESVLNLLTLSLQRRDRQQAPAAADAVALERFWAEQKKSGNGSWSWFTYGLHPVESEHSVFFGATMAAMALKAYPASAAPADRVAALEGFLRQGLGVQPLHNRLAWMAFAPGVGKNERQKVLTDLWASQSADGGWTTVALGPWEKKEKAPADTGSNAYATAWAVFTAREAGVGCGEPALQRALAWLANRQDAATGAWVAPSMNKTHAAGTTQSKFMTDMASGFAAAALISCP